MKILICDDHKLVREGIRKILQLMGDTVFFAEASNAAEAVGLLNSSTFDILLLDISLPGRSGLEILELVKMKWPATNVLILSMHPQEQYAIKALKLGASGYLTKDSASEELLFAVTKISMGSRYISPALAESLALNLNEEKTKEKHDVLSSREFEIMIRLANGGSLLDIGNDLFISNKTVSTYRRRIMDKMGFRKNTELAKYCFENKLI